MTKIIGFVTHSKKAYVCLMQLHKDVDFKLINNVINEFIGEIYQRPPVRSHVKRILRIKKIFNIEINEINNRKVLLTIESEAGTYMRKLCWDIGLVLGTGAHMRELRRIKTGPFNEDNAVTLQQISEAVYQYKTTGKEDLLRKVIIPGEYSVCELEKILVRDTAVESVINGSPLAIPGISYFNDGINRGDIVALLTLKGELIGLAKALMNSNEIKQNNKGLAFQPTRIVMERGIYPKAWKSSGKYKNRGDGNAGGGI
ncbi:MAG: RNA-guided pseudouridylation complex pseudouridine synthase subunit Cbf5 [Caldisphaera sp.]|uniref:RNA-guided pseudouridylation complex pseudouridine synthase subunit Cbf5 n=1 Tax=Caldisphaera sp. TaxID=2060322 RepID=UPI000CA662B5|nr:MAG: RNA-guided pseudouridylation complex pseudouridine synthase subunit Cbf5 [Caldisphaera sp.]